MLDWDDLRLFLAVFREGRLASAGKRLALDHTTVARRLTSLEEAVGAKLFDRSPRGATPTEAALTLVGYAERIEADVLGAGAALSQADAGVSGSVRLATPEAFGSYLVAPNVKALYARHPALQLELVPESRSVSLSKREADLSVGLNRPPKGRLVARRLAEYRLGLYASQAYLDAHGPIATVDSLGDHPLVWYIDEMIDLPELRYLNQIVAKEVTPVFRSSSIVAQQAAVASGLGLGILHVFAAEQDARLVRLLPKKIQINRSYWLVVHADQQRVARVRTVIDFLSEIVRQNRGRF